MPSKKILLLSIIVSLLAHGLLISATGLLDKQLYKLAQDAFFTVNLSETKELLPKPTRNDIKTSPLPTEPPAEVTESFDSEEETIALDSGDEKFAPYLKNIKQKIENIWTYPHEAFTRKNEGVSTVAFTVDSRGRLVKSEIIQSSGYDVLDQGTIKVIKAAAPYAPFPPEIHLSRLHIQATFRYRFLQ